MKLASGFAEVTAYTLYILALEREPFFVSFLSSTYCVFSTATSESALQQREEIRFLHFTAFRALFKKDSTF